METTGTTNIVSDYDYYNQHRDINYFEEVIDALMLDKYSEEDDIKNYINSLPLDKKRMGILSLLSGDNNLWLRIKALTDKNINKMEHIKDIILMLREYVKVGEVEKKKFGEVMTPLELVKEMLATLPEEVWTNPNLKWLDPANGTGPYPIMVIYKLMNGLKDWEPDDEKRYKHIVENMIYVCELQPKNMFLYLCAVDPFDTYKLNIYTGSFLEDGFDKHMKEVWGFDKFDIVMGNPPYNDGSGNKGNTLWDKFVIKSISILEKNGYLNTVHPGGWRNIEGKFDEVKKSILSKELIYLKLNSFEDGMKTFGVGTNFDFYCLKNSDDEIETKLIDIDNKEYSIHLKNVKFIPNCNIEEIYSLISNNNDNRIKIISSYDYEPRREWMNSVEEKDYKYPCVYSVKSGGIPTFKWSRINNRGHFGVAKIICGNGANPTYMLDIDGKYGMTQWAFGIIDHDIDNLKKIYEFLGSEKIKEITRATKFISTAGNPVIYPKIIQLFKRDFWKEFLPKNENF